MPNMRLLATDQIASQCRYCDTSEEFFGNFANAWDAVRCQVAKLETRQTYVEADNPSLAAFAKGEREESLRLMTEAMSADDEIYEYVRREGIDFLRCRPVAYPLSTYLEWELETYKLTSQKGERIFCCNYSQLDSFFEETAKHDFMVFDARVAFIHDYDDSGQISGGWVVDDVDMISALLSIFGFIKANCRPFEMFMR